MVTCDNKNTIKSEAIYCVFPKPETSFRNNIRWQKEEVCFIPWFTLLLSFFFLYLMFFPPSPWPTRRTMGNVYAITWPGELLGQDQLWHAMDTFSFLSVSSWPSVPDLWLASIPSYYFNTRINCPVLFSLGCLWSTYACSCSIIWK